MAPYSGQQVEECRDQQEHGRRNQTGRVADQAEPLDHAHHAVHGGAHVVRREAAHESIEFGRGRADAEEEGDLKKDEYQARDSAARISNDRASRAGEAKGAQAEHAEDDEEDIEVKDVGNAQGDAEDDAEDAGPAECASAQSRSMIPVLVGSIANFRVAQQNGLPQG